MLGMRTMLMKHIVFLGTPFSGKAFNSSRDDPDTWEPNAGYMGEGSDLQGGGPVR